MMRLWPLLIATIFALGPASAFAADATAQARARPENQAPAQGQAALANPLATQPLEALSVTRDRPLFSSNRRPPPPPPVAPSPESLPPPPPPPPPNLALVAIVLDATEAVAAVRTGASSEFTRLRIGDDIGGWKVSQIEGRKLVLSLDDRLATFTLFSGTAGERPSGSPISNPTVQPQKNAPPENQQQQKQLQPNAPKPRKQVGQ